MSKGDVKSLNKFPLIDAELRKYVNQLENELKEFIDVEISKVTNQIPTNLSQMNDDSSHRVVSDDEKTYWSGKANTSDLPTKIDDLDRTGYKMPSNDEWNNLNNDIYTLNTKTNELIEDNVELENLVNTSVTNMNTAMSLEKTEREAAINLEKTNRENADASINAKIYPIGSIYISTESTSPASLFGGDWLPIKDAFLWGVGDTTSFTYTENGVSVTKSLTAGSTGGEATHKLTIEEMPSHYHDMKGKGEGNQEDSLEARANYGEWIKAGTTYSAGGDQPHNNMPPYLAVYMWKRIS